MKAVFFASLGMLLSSSAFSASLIPENNVLLLVVNGVKTESKTEAVTIEPGLTQAVVQVSKKMKKGTSKRVFDSKPYILTFEAGNDDVEIAAPKLYSYDQAINHFKKGPEWQVSSNDQSVEYSSELLPPDDGLMPYYDVEKIMAEYNEKHNIYFGETAAVVAGAAIAGSVDESVQSASNIDQLKAWYLKADKAERKEFRKWMIDQE